MAGVGFVDERAGQECDVPAQHLCWRSSDDMWWLVVAAFRLAFGARAVAVFQQSVVFAGDAVETAQTGDVDAVVVGVVEHIVHARLGISIELGEDLIDVFLCEPGDVAFVVGNRVGGFRPWVGFVVDPAATGVKQHTRPGGGVA